MSYQLKRPSDKASGDQTNQDSLRLDKDQTVNLKRAFDYNQTVGLKKFRQTPHREEISINQPTHHLPEPEVLYEPETTETRKPSGWLRFAQVLFTFVLVGLAAVSFGITYGIDLFDTTPQPTAEELGHVVTSDIKLDEQSAKDYLYARDQSLNVLIMGVDEAGYDEGRSDAMILLTLRQDSSVIKMTSFMRDTVCYVPSQGTYEKLNHNYAYGGPIETIRALNMNYDLNISDYVVFDNQALIDLINEIGGVEVEFDEGEIEDYNYVAINGWETKADPIYEPGKHLINGYQAKIYMQIRQNSGGDEARTARQREVMYDIFSRSKELGKKKLLGLVQDMLPKIRTSYSMKTLTKLVDYYDEIRTAATIAEATFPFEKDGLINNEVWYEVPVTVNSNVAQLHNFLYDVDNYQLTDRAQEYADAIQSIFAITEPQQ